MKYIETNFIAQLSLGLYPDWHLHLLTGVFSQFTLNVVGIMSINLPFCLHFLLFFFPPFLYSLPTFFEVISILFSIKFYCIYSYSFLTVLFSFVVVFISPDLTNCSLTYQSLCKVNITWLSTSHILLHPWHFLLPISHSINVINF